MNIDNSTIIEDNYSINELNMELNSIMRFMHYTTEQFDDWDWDGKELRIYSSNYIEVYNYDDLKEMNIGIK